MTIEIKDSSGSRVMLLGDREPLDRPGCRSIYIEPTNNRDCLSLGGIFPVAPVLAALGVAPDWREKLAAAWDEGAQAMYTRRQRDESLPLTNPYRTPPFVLPTTAGARFEAVDNCGKHSVFRAVWAGPDLEYLNERTSTLWNGENLLEYCTDHRLIEDGQS